MRLDKYLKVSRIIKRRTVAKEASEGGRVTLNGKVAKPSTEVREGDVIAARGLGKLRLETVGGRTKKDRISVMILRYI